LYGGRASLVLTPDAGGGTIAMIRVPYRRIGSPPDTGVT
jgi:hypothetical protein